MAPKAGRDKIKGLIFDVLGTLVDGSGFPRERIWKLIREEGVDVDLKEYYELYDRLTESIFNWPKIKEFIPIREMHRQRLRCFYQKYGVERDIEADLDYLWRCMGQSKIYPEVPHIWPELQGRYKLGLLSNADEDDPLIDLLISSGYHFDSILTSESMRTYKPQTKIFKRMLSNLGLKEEEVLLIGDSQTSDILGGKEAGLRVVWVNRRGEKLKQGIPKPDYQIPDLRGLLKILRI